MTLQASRNHVVERSRRYRVTGRIHMPLRGSEVMPRIEEPLPKYVQIANYLRHQIVAGSLVPGDELPSERSIVEEWGVSRPTATKALSVLRMEGLVEARQGSGTFVRAQPGIYRRARDRYTRAKSTGRAYTAGERSEIRQASITSATEHVAAALDLDPEGDVICRTRAIFEASEPIELSTSWFRPELAEQAPRLLELGRIREGTVAYVEAMTGRKPLTASDRVSARLATPSERFELDLGEGPAAVLLVHHLTYDAAGSPLEFVEAVHPAGRWMFEAHYPLRAPKET